MTPDRAKAALDDWPFNENGQMECYGDGDSFLFKHRETIREALGVMGDEDYKPFSIEHFKIWRGSHRGDMSDATIEKYLKEHASDILEFCSEINAAKEGE